MTYPLPITTVRPGPSGSARAGSTTGFTNLAADLDTNFNAIHDWASSVRALLDPVTYATGWLTPAANWAFALPATNNDVSCRRIGKLVAAGFGLSYTGSIVSSATGDTSPDILMGTITNVNLRPALPAQIAMTGYQGTFVMASVTLNTDGTLYLTGLSAATTAVNPGFCATSWWVTSAY
jgi:hypothetical protein